MKNAPNEQLPSMAEHLDTCDPADVERVIRLLRLK